MGQLHNSWSPPYGILRIEYPLAFQLGLITLSKPSTPDHSDHSDHEHRSRSSKSPRRDHSEESTERASGKRDPSESKTAEPHTKKSKIDENSKEDTPSKKHSQVSKESETPKKTSPVKTELSEEFNQIAHRLVTLARGSWLDTNSLLRRMRASLEQWLSTNGTFDDMKKFIPNSTWNQNEEFKPNSKSERFDESGGVKLEKSAGDLSTHGKRASDASASSKEKESSKKKNKQSKKKKLDEKMNDPHASTKTGYHSEVSQNTFSQSTCITSHENESSSSTSPRKPSQPSSRWDIKPANLYSPTSINNETNANSKTPVLPESWQLHSPASTKSLKQERSIQDKASEVAERSGERKATKRGKGRNRKSNNSNSTPASTLNANESAVSSATLSVSMEGACASPATTQANSFHVSDIPLSDIPLPPTPDHLPINAEPSDSKESKEPGDTAATAFLGVFSLIVSTY